MQHRRGIDRQEIYSARILSLDGGVIRGIVLIEIMSMLEEELKPLGSIVDFMDVIVGTSIGKRTFSIESPKSADYLVMQEVSWLVASRSSGGLLASAVAVLLPL